MPVPDSKTGNTLRNIGQASSLLNFVVPGLGVATQAGLGLAGAYFDSKEKARLGEEMAKQQRDMGARDSYFQNKTMSRYNDDLMRKNLVQDGDFSKAGPIYQQMLGGLNRQSAVSQQQLADDAQKRGLGGTGLVQQGTTQLNNSVGSALANGMGQYANSLQANPNLINSAYGMNTGAQQQLKQTTDAYNNVNPSLGGVTDAIGSGLDLYDSYRKGKENEKTISNILDEYIKRTKKKDKTIN